jgi:hypothetical protein
VTHPTPRQGHMASPPLAPQAGTAGRPPGRPRRWARADPPVRGVGSDYDRPRSSSLYLLVSSPSREGLMFSMKQPSIDRFAVPVRFTVSA